MVHSVPIQFSSNWYIIHLLYIQFQFQLDIQIHIETNLTFGIYSLYIQFHILRHDISQFDIRQTFSYRFRATFSDGTFHNKIFIIHLVQFCILIHDILQLEIRYAFRSTFLYIKFHNWIFIIHSVPHTLTKYDTIGCVLCILLAICRYKLWLLDFAIDSESVLAMI